MDKIDLVLAQWQQARPDLDCRSMAVIGRLARLVTHLERPLAANFAAFGLKDGEFDVLATLRRHGAPYQLTPTALYTSLLLTSGAISKRLDRLETAGLIGRHPDPADRRGTLIRLTEQGLAVTDAALAAHVALQDTLLATLDDAEQADLARLLGKWLQHFPGETPS